MYFLIIFAYKYYSTLHYCVVVTRSFWKSRRHRVHFQIESVDFEAFKEKLVIKLLHYKIHNWLIFMKRNKLTESSNMFVIQYTAKYCVMVNFLCYSSFFGTNATHYASHAHSPSEAKSGYPYIGQLGGMDMGRVHWNKGTEKMFICI